MNNMNNTDINLIIDFLEQFNDKPNKESLLSLCKSISKYDFDITDSIYEFNFDLIKQSDNKTLKNFLIKVLIENSKCCTLSRIHKKLKKYKKQLETNKSDKDEHKLILKILDFFKDNKIGLLKQLEIVLDFYNELKDIEDPLFERKFNKYFDIKFEKDYNDDIDEEEEEEDDEEDNGKCNLHSDINININSSSNEDEREKVFLEDVIDPTDNNITLLERPDISDKNDISNMVMSIINEKSQQNTSPNTDLLEQLNDLLSKNDPVILRTTSAEDQVDNPKGEKAEEQTGVGVEETKESPTGEGTNQGVIILQELYNERLQFKKELDKPEIETILFGD